MKLLACFTLVATVLSSQLPGQAPRTTTVTLFEGARLIMGDGQAPIESSAFIVDNGAFCVLDDSIAWDRAPTHLFAKLADKYGPLVVALIFAHEMGHAISYRMGLFNQNLPTIDTESQAATLELALRVLETAPAARTTVQSPQRWRDDASWKLDFMNLDTLTEAEIAERRKEFDGVKAVIRTKQERA